MGEFQRLQGNHPVMSSFARCLYQNFSSHTTTHCRQQCYIILHLNPPETKKVLLSQRVCTLKCLMLPPTIRGVSKRKVHHQSPRLEISVVVRRRFRIFQRLQFKPLVFLSMTKSQIFFVLSVTASNIAH